MVLCGFNSENYISIIEQILLVNFIKQINIYACKHVSSVTGQTKIFSAETIFFIILSVRSFHVVLTSLFPSVCNFASSFMSLSGPHRQTKQTSSVPNNDHSTSTWDSTKERPTSGLLLTLIAWNLYPLNDLVTPIYIFHLVFIQLKIAHEFHKLGDLRLVDCP